MRKKSRIYILPTRMGGYLNGLIFLMFLLSVGYSNNLLLIFTLFLFSLNLLWLVQSHMHLHQLKLGSFRIAEGHAGASVPVQIWWKSSPKGPVNWEIALLQNELELNVSLSEMTVEKGFGEVKFQKRGRYHLTHLRVTSRLPFGLYRVWVYFPLNVITHIYPQLRPRVLLFPKGEDFEGEVSQNKKGFHDFRGLVPYQAEESRRINWKHYARSGELLVNEGEEMKSPMVEFNLQLPDSLLLKEEYLSDLATQMVECMRQQVPFSFKSGPTTYSAAYHSSHLASCLKVLAVC